MYTLIRALFLITLLLSGQATWATPRVDAQFIAQRDFDTFWKEKTERALKTYFVEVYFKPISGFGIKIADEDKFIGLIPDEEIAPYIDHVVSSMAEANLSILNPEQLSKVVAIMRVDEDATAVEILSEAYEQELAVALERARSNTNKSGPNAQLLIELEELTVQLEALRATSADDGAKFFGKSMALGLAPLVAMDRPYRIIKKIEKSPENPVTLSALRTEGVLRFANPVQRQSLLRQFSASDSGDGIQFKRPPNDGVHSN